VRPKRFLPDCREDPKGKSIAYFWASDAEGDVKIDELGLKSWAAIAEFLGQSVSLAERWQRSGRPSPKRAICLFVPRGTDNLSSVQ
jgi:hypothetical protein